MTGLETRGHRANGQRHDWNLEEVRAIHDGPVPELIFRAQSIHRQNFHNDEVELATLMSIKTGGCTEDCGYCSQSIHHKTSLVPTKLATVEAVESAARRAKELGATRFCMGAAWREVRDGSAFDRVLGMVRAVKALDLEVCVTLGMLTDSQAEQLKSAGLDVYNHNLDTSREYYGQVTSTRTYDERLTTLRAVRRNGISICSGGIIGMGETIDDRCRLLIELAAQEPHPESVPINMLVPIPGTPLSGKGEEDPIALVRMIATARIMLPQTRVRLSAGRERLSPEAQLMCFVAGANSIFFGEKLLTAPNAESNTDLELLRRAGLRPRVAHSHASPHAGADASEA